MIFKYELGAVAKDKVTGFKGLIVGRAEYLTGCIKYALQPQQLNKEGKAPDWEWFDEMMIEEAAGKKLRKEPSMGGPMKSYAPKDR